MLSELNGLVELEQKYRNFDLWIENLRSAIIWCSRNQNHSNSKGYEETIEHFILLIYFLQNLEPDRIREKSTPNFNIYDKRSSNRPKQKFCELCWRKTNNTNLSRTKFCSFHNPSDPTTRSNYERDLRYKKAFQHELACMSGKKKSKFLIQFYNYGQHFGVPEFRKAAYDLVHSGINTEYRRSIHQLHLNGKSNSEITRKLKITRQAVSKELRYIQNRIENYKRAMYIHPVTDDPVDKIYCDQDQYNFFTKKFPERNLFVVLE